jgi:hypothetical protein
MPSVWDDVTNERPGLLGKGLGIYENVPFEEYGLWPAINHTRLVRMDKSPLNYRIAPDREPSQAFALGSLVHTGRLEPDLLKERYVMMPDFANMPGNKDGKGNRSTSSATTWCKEKTAEFRKEAEASGREVITEAQWRQFDGAMAAMKTCPEFVRDINKSETELSIVWNDKRTGLLCKARIDGAMRGKKLIDLKTCDDSQSSGPLGNEFDWRLAKYNYASQAAWYQEGWFVLTGERLPFWFAVATVNRPHQCIYAPVGDMTVNWGQNKNIERMSKVMQCETEDNWPGYESPVIFELPERYLEDEVTL